MADKQGELDFGEKEKTWGEKLEDWKAQRAEEKATEEKAKAEERAAKEKAKQEEKAQKEKEKAEKKAQKEKESAEKKAEIKEKAKDFAEKYVPGYSEVSGAIKGIQSLSNGLTNGAALTEEQRKELDAKAKAEQESDVKALKSETETLEKEGIEKTETSAEEKNKSMENLLKKYIDNMDNSFIYNESPRTIRQAYKSGKFGQVMTDDLRKQYRAEMEKPEKERNKDILEKYKNAREAQHARNFYIMDAIATGMANVGSALQGGQGGKEAKWNQLQGARIADAQQRYKDLLDTKANEVIENAKNKGELDRANESALRNLYQDKRLQPILNKLDVDTQTQLLRLINQKGDALTFDTFINALAMQIINNPGGAVSGVFGAVNSIK